MELLMNTSSQVRVPQSEHDEPPNGTAGRMHSVVCDQEDLGGTDLGHRRDAYSTSMQRFRPELMYGASRDS